MSRMALPENSTERFLLDLPYEILFEMFRNLSRSKLIEISKLSSKLRDAAGDTRFWKDVNIKYESAFFAFDDLYSEPWPVKTIDLTSTYIQPPFSSRTSQTVKVTKLNLTSVKTNMVTMEAILAKYQCTELHLDSSQIDSKLRVAGIAPETFSKQTALEVLSLRDISHEVSCHQWLAPVLSNCKHLKTLDLTCTEMNVADSDMSGFVKEFPVSLEKLCLTFASPKDSFFKILAERIPNLRELELSLDELKCPSLLEFQFLETLHIAFGYRGSSVDITELHMRLIKFPALKTVYIVHHSLAENSAVRDFEVRTKLEPELKPHGIAVELIEESQRTWSYPIDGNLWKVSRAV